MNSKQKAIEGLRAIAHWMETSGFDYEERDLIHVLGEVRKEYMNYLNEKNGSNE